MGNGSALEVLHDDALYKSTTFFTLLIIVLYIPALCRISYSFIRPKYISKIEKYIVSITLVALKLRFNV